MSRRKHWLISLAVVTVPWGLVILPLAAGRPQAALLALSPASLAVLFMGPQSFAATLGLTLAGATVLFIAVALMTRRRQVLLLPIGYGIFFLAVAFAVALQK